MKLRKSIFYIVTVTVLLALTFGTAMADEDGVMFRRNISKTPAGETEKAGMSMLYFYVPAQNAAGEILTEGIPYETDLVITTDPDTGQETGTVGEPVLVDTRYYAKPLTSIYIDEEHVEETLVSGIGITSGMSIGAHDAFVAHSLDDGATWKSANLSESADLSSFNLANGTAYPGDVYAAVQATAGDRVIAAWLSRYCDGGEPSYTLEEEEVLLLQGQYDLSDLYMTDIWGVTGSQKSVDYTKQGFPEVGEIPYGCVWTARGVLLPREGDTTTGLYDIVWTKAERLTSGRRDANRLEIDARANGGFAITWQEDPEGLRPGQGLGPGEGWSGAIVNAKTDIWYSYITWDDFAIVDPDDDITTIGEPLDEAFLTTYDINKPKVAIPMSMPVRLTDNDQCKGTSTTEKPEDPYCYIDFDNLGEDGEVDLPELDSMPAAGTSSSDFCATIVNWTNPGGTSMPICQTEDGRTLTGRVGASRPRVGLYPISDPITGAERFYFVMAYEETKALGEGSVEDDTITDPVDIGKNIWYHSFEFTHPDMVAQGGMLNQPALDPATGLFFDFIEPDPTNLAVTDVAYETEIARRFSMIAQPYANIGESRTTAYLLFKQGILNQGGPADIFARRVVLPETFDPVTENPYDYKYIACDEWAFTDGLNANYVNGLCISPAINLSGTNIVECDNGTSGDACADVFPWDGGESPFPKVTQWSQTVENLTQQSWNNPYDVAKGHRGFLDGDFLMVLYAWSPNWQANAVGNDHYNLYIRRSFDGGVTYTTTPAELEGDGTTTCENYIVSGEGEQICTTYGPGEFEQARNVSQLIGNKITILDPRYTPTGGLKQLTVTDALEVSGLNGGDELPYEDDAARNSSVYYAIFETGDNTTVTEGEAVPLDLYYSRADNWGDDYSLDIDYEDPDTSDNVLQTRWDWAENNRDNLSGEAGMTASPGGDFMYAVWNQWCEDEYENVFDSDIWFRRFFFNSTLEIAPSTNISGPESVMFDTDSELDLVAVAKDNDRLGEGTEIVEYEWTIDGVIDPTVTGSHYNAPPRTLSNGWHGFGVRVKDNDGKWSKPQTIKLLIVEDIHTVFIPLLKR